MTSAYYAEQSKYGNNKNQRYRNSGSKQKSSIAWKIVNEISGRNNSNSAKLKVSSNGERIKIWHNHFQELLGSQLNKTDDDDEEILQIHNKLNIKIGLFTIQELNNATKSINNGKACGLDEIPAEVWKLTEFQNILLNFCNSVYSQNQIKRWTEGCLLPFPKKGDISQAKNYRGITLTSITAKIYNLMLLNRIRPEIDPILRKNQNGFRQNRSTTGQILTIRRIIEGVRSKNLPATLLFVDFAKAFDSIHRGKMKNILSAYGIPSETVEAIMILYRETKSMVRSPYGDTPYFEITTGVLQGDTLVPFLFIICLDYVLRKSLDDNKHLGLTIKKRMSSRHPAIYITDTDYADDLAITSDNVEDANIMLHKIEEAAAEIGLGVNADKTEYISLNQKNNSCIKSLKG